MEDVDLVQRDELDVAQHVVDGEEVAGDVEHRPAVREARPIGDLGAGRSFHGPGCADVASAARAASGAAW